MPWKECHVVDERLRFVARLLDGEKMTALCAEFGISRKTGYKIYDRYKDYGVHGLTDRSRREPAPGGPGNADCPVEKGLPGLGRAEDPREAARPVRAVTLSGHQHRPRRARSARFGATSGASTPPRDRHGVVADQHTECALVCRFQRRVSARRPAVLLSADHHRFRHRYLLACEALVDHARSSMPSPSSNAPSRTSGCRGRSAPTTACPSRRRTPSMGSATVGLVAAARHRHRTHQAGHPEQNGRHERMHLTLQATKRPNRRRPISCNSRRASTPSSSSTTTSGHTRPRHECPGRSYVPSPRPYRGLASSTTRFTIGRTVTTADGSASRRPQDQSQSGVCRPDGRRPAGGRAHLARQLHAL